MSQRHHSLRRARESSAASGNHAIRVHNPANSGRYRQIRAILEEPTGLRQRKAARQHASVPACQRASMIAWPRPVVQLPPHARVPVRWFRMAKYSPTSMEIMLLPANVSLVEISEQSGSGRITDAGRQNASAASISLPPVGPTG